MKILLVDDEPIFLRQLKRIIMENNAENRCHNEVVAECFSGEEALDVIQETSPDAVFTDIQMSTLDGIEFAKTIQKRWPHLPVVIISAFPSFDYVREAMRANVIDYLLKPVDTDAVKHVLEKLQNRMTNKMYLRTREIIYNQIQGTNPSALPESIEALAFPYTGYWMLLTQRIGVPYDDHFLLPQIDETYEQLRTLLQQALHEQEEIWIFNSGNNHEVITIFGIQSLETEKRVRLISVIQSFFASVHTSPSVSYPGTMIELKDLYLSLQCLAQLLQKQYVIGMPKRIDSSIVLEDPHFNAHLFSDADAQQIKLLLTKNDWRSLKDATLRLFHHWKENELPAIYVEKNLKIILGCFETHFNPKDPVLSKTLDKRVEEIIFTAASFEEAAEAFWSIVNHIFHPEAESANALNINKRNLFKQIEAFLASQLTESLTLADLKERFEVSSTYLCNLFRDNCGMTFVEYFTSLRIQKAKDYMRYYPHMLLKDIAESVGYTDQGYFTRVFRTLVGLNPTEYKSSLDRNP